MIKWKEKGPIKALGIHHGASVGVPQYILSLWIPILGTVYGSAMVGWYLHKEYRENGAGFGWSKCEWLDIATPLLLSVGLTLKYFL